jgi:hypothetical protein
MPVERLARGYGPLYALVLASLQDLSDDDRADVLAGTARRFYRLPSPGRTARGRRGGMRPATHTSHMGLLGSNTRSGW